MAFFQKRPKTSQQKAQKAQMGILARLIGCGYLIYVVVKLLGTSSEDDTMSPTIKLVIAIFFLIAAAFVIFITVQEFIRNWRSGFYRTTSYTDDAGSAAEEEQESDSEAHELQSADGPDGGEPDESDSGGEDVVPESEEYDEYEPEEDEYESDEDYEPEDDEER